jgi:hypothetical protein
MAIGKGRLLALLSAKPMGCQGHIAHPLKIFA